MSLAIPSRSGTWTALVSSIRGNLPTQPLLETTGWAGRYARTLALLDMAMITAALTAAAAVGLQVTSRGAALPPTSVQIAVLAVFGIAWFLVLTASRSRHRYVVGMGPTEYTRVFRPSLRLFGAVAVLAFAFQAQVDRIAFTVAFALGCTLLLAGRYTARQWLGRERAAGRCTSAVVVLGPPAGARELIATLNRDVGAGLHVVGVCVPSTGRDEAPSSIDGVPVIGDLAGVPEAAARVGADVVAVTGSDAVTSAVVRQLGWDLEATGIDLVMAPALTDIAGPRVATRPVNGTSLLHVEAPRFAGWKYWVKAALDLTVTAIITAALLPVMAVIALLVRVTSAGPVIFTQERIGLDGRPFAMFKFRSMYADAEERLAQIQHLSEGNGVLFKMRDDPRVTPIGAVLRKFSLDELPQLFNVLRGQMSLVGPRPPLRREVDLYEPHVHRRLFVKPGITGLWQVSGRSDLTWEESVRLDLYYAENWSPFGDLLILARTARVVLFPRGAY
ncbi:MAG: sugar transferase [Cellulomonadaceae bacterium]